MDQTTNISRFRYLKTLSSPSNPQRSAPPTSPIAGGGHPDGEVAAMPVLSKHGLPLLKQRSWSPDSDRDEAWLRRKGLHRAARRSATRSVTDADLDDLRGCIDLGFVFDDFDLAAPASEAKRLAETLPALGLYYAVHRSVSPSVSSSDAGSPAGSPLSIMSPGDSPDTVKARLKQWAQVVACSVHQKQR